MLHLAMQIRKCHSTLSFIISQNSKIYFKKHNPCNII